jgi:hypothetical protein
MIDNGGKGIITPEEFEDLFNKAESSANRVHGIFIEGSTKSGYIIESIKVSRRIYSFLVPLSYERPELREIVNDGIQYIRSLTEELDSINDRTAPIVIGLNTTANTAYTMLTTSGISLPIEYYRQLDQSVFEPPSFVKNKPEELALRLSSFNPIVGLAYKSSNESRYATSTDSLRAALFMMRQTYDSFFTVLAPDEKVRNSPYWIVKEGDKPNSVHREERINYAANVSIADPGLRKIILASTKSILDTYESLNRAHSRKEIDESRAINALDAMTIYLNIWLDAIS